MRRTSLCYIERGDEYLMLHRVKKAVDENAGKWIGVGGGFEEGESPEACMLREVYEETGLRLCAWRYRGVVTFLSDVWGGEVKYLKSVVSPGDELSENLTSVVDMTESEFESCCKKLKNCTLPDDKTKWIGKAERTQAGAVKQIAVGNGTYGGAEMQKAFELKSNNFTLEHNGDSFVFTVVGSGHGVGMSQYGADFMARRGSNYEEILKHYYTGVEIVDF